MNEGRFRAVWHTLAADFEDMGIELRKQFFAMLKERWCWYCGARLPSGGGWCTCLDYELDDELKLRKIERKP